MTTTARPDKVPVSSVALARRITRELARRGLRLRAQRNKAAQPHLPRLYVVDVATAAVVAWHDDLIGLARELAVLAPHEVVS